MISHFVPQKKLIPVWSADSASPFGIWKKTFVNNHFTIFGNLEIIIIHCWKVKILSPSLQFINYLSDLSSVGNNIVHFLKENWLGYLKMSLLLTLGGQKAKKLKRTKWGVFCGTPCSNLVIIILPYLLFMACLLASTKICGDHKCSWPFTLYNLKLFWKRRQTRLIYNYVKTTSWYN